MINYGQMLLKIVGFHIKNLNLFFLDRQHNQLVDEHIPKLDLIIVL
jgi:hypothetical protein